MGGWFGLSHGGNPLSTMNGQSRNIAVTQTEAATEGRPLMRLRPILLLGAIAGLVLAVLPAAVASPPEISGLNYASVYLEGVDDGFDFAEARLTEYSSPGTSDVYLFLVVCDVKTDEWPEPGGLEPECWDTGYGGVGDQVLVIEHYVFSPGQVRFAGEVEMFCTYAWLCGGQPSRMVHVDLEWDVDSTTHSHAQFSPLPGVNVSRDTWDLEMSGFTMELDGLPIDLEAMHPTDHFDGQIEKTHVDDQT